MMLLISDITYIRIRTDFVYLAAILDAYSRKVVGYAVSTKLDTALTLTTHTLQARKAYNRKLSDLTRIIQLAKVSVKVLP